MRHSVKCDYKNTLQRVTAQDSNNRPVVTSIDSNNQPTADYAFISSSQQSFAIPKRAHAVAGPSPVQSSSSSESESSVIQKPFQFTASDMILFHHCLSAEDLKDHIPDQLMKLGLSVHYVLHLLLAVSGFHLRRQLTNERIHQLLDSEFDSFSEAERHLKTAIAQVAAVSSNLNQENSHALYVASLFIFICSLARGPQPGEYLAFRADGDMPVICLFTGMRSILETMNTLGTSQGISRLHSSDRQEIPLHPESEPGQIPDSPWHRPAKYNIIDASCHYSESLNNLRLLIMNTFSPSDARHTAYCDAFESLQSRYDSILNRDVLLNGPELWPQIFSWLYLLPDIVLNEMQQMQPVSLLLFSHFAVLLNELSSVWFIRGWPSHIVEGIQSVLGEEHQHFLIWPLTKLGCS